MRPPGTDGVVSLESVLCTDTLKKRPSRPPDHERENRALLRLSQTLADSPGTILQKLADTILDILQVGSAGVSVLTSEDGGKRFVWPAVAGSWKHHIGGGTPRDFSPCGDVLDRDVPLLFGKLERRYTYFQPVTPAVEEALLAPFYVAGNAVGTIWAVAHDDRKFDNEDLRLLVNLGQFASSAYQAWTSLKALEEHAGARAGLAAIVDSSTDAIIGSSLDGIITAWNRAAEAMLGYTAAEAAGQRIALIVPAELHAAESDLRARVGRGDSLDPTETERQTKEGRRVSISLTVSPIRDSVGRIVGASQIARDITRHKQMEAALRLSEIRYRRLFQTAKDGILILDATTGRVVDANAFLCGLLGQELAEMVGRELHEMGLFEDKAASRAAFEELQHNGYLRHDHLPVRRRDGETTPVEFVGNVYREGDRLMAQCNVRDISDRARMDEEIKRQAEAMAEQHRLKDEFLAMLSHELRNPLAPIRSATHLLRLQEGGSNNPIQQQAREVIDRQVTHLTRLVSDLLEISRVATGRIRLSLEKVDMRQIVQDALEMAGPLIEQRRHQVVLTLTADAVWVLADATRMQEVVVNLVNNAAKYTDEGGQIEVSLEHGRNEAVLRVRDSGTGIAPELLPRIFDLFTQADRSLDRSQGGLGIGLNLVQRLVQLHGGRVDASSAGLGQGSEFVVRLTTVSPPGLGTAIIQAPQSATGLRVLVVDDNVDACQMMATLLKQAGHAVQMADSGPSGLRAALASTPDVVLLDIGLPELDGYEVARRLRHDPVTKDVRLVALTGYGTAADVQLAREAGFDAHMLKPVDLGEVEKLLETWK